MTALKAFEVDRYLEKPDLQAGVFLVYGSDAGMVREAGRRLIAHYAGSSPDPMAHTNLDAADLDSQSQRLHTEVRTSSLFGGRRTVRVRGAAKALTAQISVLLDDMPDAILVLEAGNLPRGDSLRALAEARQNARALPCYADNEKSLGQLVRATFESARITCGPDVVPTLIALLGSDREISRRELEKLVLFAGDGGTLTAVDVEALCGDNSGRAADAVIDAVAGGHAAAFDEAFRAALSGGIDGSRLLAVALGHFAMLRRLRAEIDAGKPSRSAIESLRPRLHFSRTSAVDRQLRLWTDPMLANAGERIYAAVLDSRRHARLTESLTQRTLLAICVAAAQR